jgi:hypothetical protein
MIYKILHKKLLIKQHKPNYNPGAGLSRILKPRKFTFYVIPPLLEHK